ncbi:MAG: FecR domain-containing protein [Fibrobacter sp.]|uniref:FecR family protein n=1 Tax=Fibrobacter sp. TaxID=35828 RepID=UPI0025BB7F11|nr:FecR family protein [Fibrobacter sp.]MBQ9225032.1 FecR domain-containing protein [Fibrobacter sp.]
MIKSYKLSLCLVAALSATVFWACKDEPDPRTVADNKSEAVDTSKIKAKVRKVLGETDLQRKNTEKWSKLRFGQTVAEKDRIRTGAESEAVMAINDGSSLWITELSDVVLDAEIFDSLNHQVSVRVNNGAVLFDVQKQPTGRTVNFTTGVATAAIRGTAGFVASVNGQMVTSLKQGLVSVNSIAGNTGEVVQNQTLIVGKNGVIKNLNLKSSGTKALSMELANVNIWGMGPESEEFEKALTDFDNDYEKRREEFAKKVNFRANPLPDTLMLPSVTLQARVNPGIVVTVMGESDTVPESGIYQRTVEWADDSYGPKRFSVTCSEGDIEIECFTWKSNYTPPSKPAGDDASADSAARADSIAAAEAAAAEAAAAEKAAAEKAAGKNAAGKKADQADASTANEKKTTKSVNVSLKLVGGKTERKHLDPPAKEYKTNLKFSLAGITDADISEIASVTVKRKGEVVQSFNNVSALTYEVPVSIDLNTIAKFDIEIALKSGKKIRTTKTYEVFCFSRNHMAKARNCVLYDKVDGGGCDESHAEEYQYVKDNGILKED